MNARNHQSSEPTHRLLSYIAELELEVDRLRKYGQVLYQEAATAQHRIVQLCQAAPSENLKPTLSEIETLARQALETLRELRSPPGYHPSHDHVVDIAFRPLVEKIFRWQQRLAQLPNAALHLDLQPENLEWFPARLSHILDNLIGNALAFSDPSKGEVRVAVSLRQQEAFHEIRVSDNGMGIRETVQPTLLDLSHRVNFDLPRRPEVGLAVVKMLVEQSGGSVAIDSGEGSGSSFLVLLPRYDRDDFLTHGEQPSARVPTKS
jgi:signal transduction histidine kinase